MRNAAGRSFAPDAENALLFVSVPPEDLAGPELLDPESPLGAIAARVVLQVSDRARLAETLAPTVTADLRGRGYRLAVDELGAGQASLAAIALLLPEFVKIDATLVHGVHASDVRKRLVEAMVRAARELACEIVADGVEAPEDRDALLAIGCEVQQGPLFADPLSP